MSALGSQQGILISESTVSHCGSPMWKKQSCSEHQCIGLLEEHYSNYIMSTLNLQIHQWASSRQHQCGIKQNKLFASQSGIKQNKLFASQSGGQSCLDEWFSRHIYICMCKFMNKKWFSRLTISRQPQAGGMY